tara:strand:+ start:116 stop:649 length:534 start_codon:yes stop_codon:yes gene_type:complete
MSEIQVNTINEYTSANGVTIDGLLIKDGAIPSIAGGKVLQVVGATSSSEQQTTSTSYVDITNLTVSITPSATTSKVLIFYTDTTKTLRSSDVSSGNVFIQLLRDSTSIAVKEAGFYDSAGGNGTKSLYNGEALIHLDSPSSTSAITYKIQIKASSSTTVESQYNDNTASIIAMEIGA